MRRIKLGLGVVAMAAVAAAGVSAGTASAATQTKAQWRQAISQVQAPAASGCYRAAYPKLSWQAARCAVAPTVPLAPPRSAPPRSAAPSTVGDGHDYTAVVKGRITQAAATFRDVSPNLTESGPVGVGKPVPNAYSLQLNSQFFHGSPACAPAKDPAKCYAWQQFVYATGKYKGYVFMQYWLIDYNAKCPAGWFTYGKGYYCYTNSAAELTGKFLPASELGSIRFTATANAGGMDKVALTLGSGQAFMVKNRDTKVHLAANWTTAEWNVFGDGDGSEATFAGHVTLEPHITLQGTGSMAPACVAGGYTAETNNLTATSTPALGGGQPPAIGFRETTGTATQATCATS